MLPLFPFTGTFHGGSSSLVAFPGQCGRWETMQRVTSCRMKSTACKRPNNNAICRRSMYRNRKEKIYSPSGQLLNIFDRGTRKVGWSRDFPGLPSTSISLLGIMHSKHSCATLKKTMDQRNSNNIFPKWLVVLGSRWTYFEAVTLSGNAEALFSETQALSVNWGQNTLCLGRLWVKGHENLHPR